MVASLRNLLLLFGVLLFAPGAYAQDSYPATQADWIERLAKIQTPIGEDYGTMFHLTQGDPKLVYAVLHDGWSRFQSSTVKAYLLGLVTAGQQTTMHLDANGLMVREESCNPYLPDILGLGIQDSDAGVNAAAAQYLYGIAFKDLTGKRDEFTAWRRQNSGGLDEIVRANMEAFLSRLRTGEEQQRLRLLKDLSRIPFASGISTQMDPRGNVTTSILASGIVGIRRKAAIEMHVPEMLLGMLAPEVAAPVRELALVNLMRFQPDSEKLLSHTDRLQADLTRLVLDKNSPYYPMAGRFLSQIHTQWAMRLLLDQIAATFPDPSSSLLLPALYTTTDRQCIPTLIVLLESNELEPWQEQRIERTLRLLTGMDSLTGGQGERVVDWRKWWQAHQAELPEVVRSRPFPRLHTVGNAKQELTIRRQIRNYSVNNDPKRAYWLVSPGTLLTPSPTVEAVPQKRPMTGLPSDKVGLVVVLLNAEPNYRDVEEFWQKVAIKAFGGKYLIALAMPPRWSRKQVSPWVTTVSRALVPEAKFTAEEFAAQIVEDVASRMPVDPAHVYLHGAGASSPAVYACSLQPQTPFRGFSLLSSEFRTALLPPLTAAKGRRFYLQQSREDKSVPYFLALAAQQSLTHAGGTVLLKPVQGEHPDAMTEETLDHLSEALHWLENPAGK